MQSVTFVDWRCVRHAVTGVHHSVRRASRSVQDSLGRHVHGGHVERLKHGLRHALSVSLGVQRSFRGQNGTLFRRSPEFVAERKGGCLGHELFDLLGAREKPISTVPRIASVSNLRDGRAMSHFAPPTLPQVPGKRRPFVINSLRKLGVQWREVASVVKLAIMPNLNYEFCKGNHVVRAFTMAADMCRTITRMSSWT